MLQRFYKVATAGILPAFPTVLEELEERIFSASLFLYPDL
jgi:hypothetical protein